MGAGVGAEKSRGGEGKEDEDEGRQIVSEGRRTEGFWRRVAE